MSLTAIAGNLKMEANDYFRQRKFKEASGFYTQAINETASAIPHNLKRALYANRAACNLELSLLLSRRYHRSFVYLL